MGNSLLQTWIKCSLSGAEGLRVLGREMGQKSRVDAPQYHGAAPGDLVPRRSSGSSHGSHEASAAGEPWWEALGRRGCWRGAVGGAVTPGPEMPFGKVRRGGVKKKPMERLATPVMELHRCPLKI